MNMMSRMNCFRTNYTALLIAVLSLDVNVCFAQQAKPDHTKVPGVVIDYSAARSRKYIGSPSIAILPNGYYVASHDFFGPGSRNNRTRVHCSKDKGRTWQILTDIQGQWWSTLFLHNDNLYIMGVDKVNGRGVIRRSEDGGKTWTIPRDKNSGLLLDEGKYCCAPVPVLMHNGRIWRAMEDAMGPDGWGLCFRSFMMSAPLDADLLKADSWTESEKISWGGWEPFGGFLEGNAVVTPEGEIVDILRVHEPKMGGIAAMIQVSADGKSLTFDPEKGFIDFPGGCKKFTIRYDPASKRYWSLTNYAHDRDRQRALNVERQRNTLALTSSADLKHWVVHSIVLYHPDVRRVGFQYADWQFEKDDIIAVCRTAFGDAPNCHDANYLTFHRIRSFRNRSMKDRPLRED